MLGPARIVLPLAAAALLVAGAPGCGAKKADEPARVRETVRSFKDSVEKGDIPAICSQLLARRLVQKLEGVGLPCDVALQALKSVRRPKLKILSIKVRGKEAFATVRTNAVGQRPSQDTLHLVREGDSWRIDDLAGEIAGPPSPENPAPTKEAD